MSERPAAQPGSITPREQLKTLPEPCQERTLHELCSTGAGCAAMMCQATAIQPRASDTLVVHKRDLQ